MKHEEPEFDPMVYSQYTAEECLKMCLRGCQYTPFRHSLVHSPHWESISDYPEGFKHVIKQMQDILEETKIKLDTLNKEALKFISSNYIDEVL